MEPRWKGLNTAIPVVMVSKRAYSILLAESYGSNQISFEENAAVNSTTWEFVEKLNNGQVTHTLDEWNNINRDGRDPQLTLKRSSKSSKKSIRVGQTD